MPHRTTFRTAVTALAVVAATALAGCAASGSSSAAPSSEAGGRSGATGTSADTLTRLPGSPRTTAEGRTTAPPWSAPQDVEARAAAAGLPMLSAEGTVMHIHVHLDVIADGRRLTVPALIGIDQSARRISPLHTHDASGIIHIESPARATFTLGQFMTEWDVALSEDQLGGLRSGGGETVRAYVNGRQVKGDPAAIRFHAHDEIALVYGPSGGRAEVPARYSFPKGL